MEADLLRIWPDLPENWRERRTPSLRRLLVVVKALGPDSALLTHERGGHPPWTATEQLLDEIRRNQIHLASPKGSAFPAPHLLSPAGRAAAARADRFKRTLPNQMARSRAREAARQARLRSEVTP